MSKRPRLRDVDDTSSRVVEAALADELAAKLSRKMHDAKSKSERGLNPPDDTGNLVGPIDHSISQEMIAKAVKQRSLLRTENAARAHGVENLDATELAREESDQEAAFEPFNLEQERKEGYFDDDGTYVRNENESDEEKDAWLENVEVDREFSTAGDDGAVRKIISVDVGDDSEISDVDVATMKKTLCEYLNAGETVLGALRRLGKKKTKTPESSAKTDADKADDANVFDKITELSSTLMSHGVYDVYSNDREAFERELGGTGTGRASGEEKLPEAPEGYVFDPETGFFKNQQIGLLYCPENSGFTDGQGKWWWYDQATNSFVEWT